MRKEEGNMEKKKTRRTRPERVKVENEREKSRSYRTREKANR